MKLRDSRAILKFVTLLGIVITAFFFANLIPYSVRSFSYALSLTIKEILVFSLPFIVFSIVFQSVSNLHGAGAVKTVVLLLVMIVLSNTASVSVAHFVGKFSSLALTEKIVLSGDSGEHSAVLEPFFTFELPVLISSIKAVFFGFLAGAILPRVIGKKSEWISKALSGLSILFLEKVFAPILPVFVLGLVFRMQSDNLLDVLMSNSAVAFYLFSSAALYVGMLYLIASGFSVRTALLRMRDILPAALFAFTAMSSLMAMPMILKIAKKNTDNPNILDISVPTSLNVHTVGNSFLIIVMVAVINNTLGSIAIPLTDYLYFLLYFIAAKFAVVAVPGGGIIVMLPVIEQCLHFSPVMLSLITTLYVIFDPLITATNVLGNGAFSLLFSKAHKAISKNIS